MPTKSVIIKFSNNNSASLRSLWLPRLPPPLEPLLRFSRHDRRLRPAAGPAGPGRPPRTSRLLRPRLLRGPPDGGPGPAAFTPDPGPPSAAAHPFPPSLSRGRRCLCGPARSRSGPAFQQQLGRGWGLPSGGAEEAAEEKGAGQPGGAAPQPLPPVPAAPAEPGERAQPRRQGPERGARGHGAARRLCPWTGHREPDGRGEPVPRPAAARGARPALARARGFKVKDGKIRENCHSSQPACAWYTHV